MKQKIFILFLLTTLSFNLSAQIDVTPISPLPPIIPIPEIAPAPFNPMIDLEYPCSHFSTDIAPPTFLSNDAVKEIPAIPPSNNSQRQVISTQTIVFLCGVSNLMSESMWFFV